MSSTNKTDLGFNQWVPSDKPTMHDYNADNQLADELIGTLEEKLEGVDSVAEALAGKADVPADGLVIPTWLDVECINETSVYVQYCKVNGIVYFRGSVYPNTTAEFVQFANIPFGYRPKATTSLLAVGVNPMSRQVSCSAYIYATGEFHILKTGTGTFSASSGYFICGSYPAEQ